jgi:hypothetical protein
MQPLVEPLNKFRNFGGSANDLKIDIKRGHWGQGKTLDESGIIIHLAADGRKV